MRAQCLNNIDRFDLWRGAPGANPHLVDLPEGTPPQIRSYFAAHVAALRRGRYLPADLEAIKHMNNVPNPRLRASRAQFAAEILAYQGDIAEALHVVAIGVDAGLQDLAWMDRCPPLASIRAEPAFGPLRETVAGRARAVLAAVDAARAG